MSICSAKIAASAAPGDRGSIDGSARTMAIAIPDPLKKILEDNPKALYGL